MGPWGSTAWSEYKSISSCKSTGLRPTHCLGGPPCRQFLDGEDPSGLITSSWCQPGPAFDDLKGHFIGSGVLWGSSSTVAISGDHRHPNIQPVIL